MGLEAIQQGPLPAIAGTRSGRALVVGCGRCVWDDLAQVSDDRDVITINEMVTHFPGRVRDAYSNDSEQLPHWLASRRRAYVQQWGADTALHTVPAQPGAASSGCVVWPFPPHGSSGLCGTYVVIGLGYDDILLAGMPLDDSGHYFDPPWVKSNFLREAQERIWLQARDQVFEGRVKALSGRPRDWLGGP